MGDDGKGRKKEKKKKNAQLVLRLPRDERDAFVELCDDLDTSASREIRGFIRRFMEKKGEAAE